MPFLGYYAAETNELTTVSYPPAIASVGDTITAIWQEPDIFTTTARNFTYSIDSTPPWGADGEITSINSVMAPMYPIEGRYLAVLDPNGLGMFATNFAYVNTVRLDSSGEQEPVLKKWEETTAQVGQDTLDNASDLEVHNIFSGEVVENIPSTVGLLPIYIRNNGAVVGVGSAVYSDNKWTVLWYKMAIAAGAAPRAVYDTATILYEKEFKMIGDTTAYKLTLKDKNGQIYPPIEGDYNNGMHTVYDFSAYADIWESFTVTDSYQHEVYKARRGLTDTTYEAPTSGPLKNKSITDAMQYISKVFEGGYPVIINHKLTVEE